MASLYDYENDAEQHVSAVDLCIQYCTVLLLLMGILGLYGLIFIGF